MRRASRADANQPALVAHWRSLGGSWFSTHRLPGELDGVAGMCGIDVRVEIKDGAKPPSHRRLTDAERETMLRWRGREPVVWCSVADVEALAALLRLELTRTNDDIQRRARGAVAGRNKRPSERPIKALIDSAGSSA